jgi:hypothetical protein
MVPLGLRWRPSSFSTFFRCHTRARCSMQAHGFPRVMGVLTHLDQMKSVTKLRRTKKQLKNRFWTEIYQVFFFVSKSLLKGSKAVLSLRHFQGSLSHDRDHEFEPLHLRHEVPGPVLALCPSLHSGGPVPFAPPAPNHQHGGHHRPWKYCSGSKLRSPHQRVRLRAGHSLQAR